MARVRQSRPPAGSKAVSDIDLNHVHDRAEDVTVRKESGLVLPEVGRGLLRVRPDSDPESVPFAALKLQRARARLRKSRRRGAPRFWNF